MSLAVLPPVVDMDGTHCCAGPQKFDACARLQPACLLLYSLTSLRKVRDRSMSVRTMREGERQDLSGLQSTLSRTSAVSL
jgi:hypothetical protein